MAGAIFHFFHHFQHGAEKNAKGVLSYGAGVKIILTKKIDKMLMKEGMLAEDLRIQVGNKKYYNLAHYSPNCRYTGLSTNGKFNSFMPDIFQYDHSGKPTAAKFMPASVGNATRRIRIKISKVREEISELERELCKVVGDNAKGVVIEERGSSSFRTNEPNEIIRELINQRKDFLRMYLDSPRGWAPLYAEIESTK